MTSEFKFKRWVALTCFAFLSLNVLVCLFLIRNPDAAKINGILYRYKLYLLPGPFFKEENIRSVSIFQVQFRSPDKGWGDWIFPEKINFHEYQHNFGRYDKLKQSDFERHLARSLAVRIVKDSIIDYQNFEEFKEVNHYLHDQYAPANADSVHLLFTVKWVKLSGRQTHIDTLFNISYKED